MTDALAPLSNNILISLPPSLASIIDLWLSQASLTLGSFILNGARGNIVGPDRLSDTGAAVILFSICLNVLAS